MLDFHNHLIPAVDDGPASIDGSRVGLKSMIQQGLTAVITTPHFRGSWAGTGRGAAYLENVDSKWSELLALAGDEFPMLRLDRGLEVLIDAPNIDFSDQRMRLAGTAFVLVEFPWGGMPTFSSEALFEICTQGFSPIIAHPERYAYMDRKLELARKWEQGGAYLQVNAGSLVGSYGSRPREIAWRLLEDGLASYVGSDFHARGECLSAAAQSALRARNGGDEAVRVLMELNPDRIVQGQLPLPPGLLSKAIPWWRAIFRASTP